MRAHAHLLAEVVHQKADHLPLRAGFQLLDKEEELPPLGASQRRLSVVLGRRRTLGQVGQRVEAARRLGEGALAGCGATTTTHNKMRDKKEKPMRDVLAGQRGVKPGKRRSRFKKRSESGVRASMTKLPAASLMVLVRDEALSAASLASGPLVPATISSMCQWTQ